MFNTVYTQLSWDANGIKTKKKKKTISPEKDLERNTVS